MKTTILALAMAALLGPQAHAEHAKSAQLPEYLCIVESKDDLSVKYFVRLNSPSAQVAVTALQAAVAAESIYTVPEMRRIGATNAVINCAN